ncbi:holo-ACP synthase [Paenibacillus tengchongensis]|uniref:holo-ACP synthase n=1 Tax=Paenibacillus tengchongensis TaxID=2608684 RepID=UPI00124EC51B|nr:holo-ACP synthase [Paenibacillus tengchongensis]
MIYGIGHDVLEIARIGSLLGKTSGMKILRRILTTDELELAGQRSGRLAEFAAGRFAAKEAVVKALGCGIGSTVGFQDISILPDAQGKPAVHLSAAAWERLGMTDGGFVIHVTITHTRELASAFALVERRL